MSLNHERPSRSINSEYKRSSRHTNNPNNVTKPLQEKGKSKDTRLIPHPHPGPPSPLLPFALSICSFLNPLRIAVTRRLPARPILPNRLQYENGKMIVPKDQQSRTQAPYAPHPHPQ
ncbi:hypothetical protein SERLADRAFT_437657 [Serpula lacrymans var. lacrymans S7.9]|uniref:Uncharacterized protein n=1 Tax=Serpula lacrymans var. lacrymans (strain S7.9) TaxID=578457 RepID=F8NUT1_SERL9|nr:uncharacterized protein SERLADRAFT_437657 [Serpula lacrymans var. lacrymans S7.9]EGO25939.1 hypothetical protein SERLADRAFT_437657 [Serpula lacrymans var. lacrymans S7.9]